MSNLTHLTWLLQIRLQYLFISGEYLSQAIVVAGMSSVRLRKDSVEWIVWRIMGSITKAYEMRPGITHPRAGWEMHPRSSGKVKDSPVVDWLGIVFRPISARYQLCEVPMLRNGIGCLRLLLTKPKTWRDMQYQIYRTSWCHFKICSFRGYGMA